MNDCRYYKYNLYLIDNGWKYRIYDSNFHDVIIHDSKEYYESEQRALFAAVGHIELLKKGEHHD